MTGMELIMGGKVVGTVIGKVIKLGGFFLGDNYDLHTNSKKLLKNLVEKQLPDIQNVIEEADNRQITNKHLAEWLEKLKDAVYEAEDVVDNFEAKRIRESIKGKGKLSEIASSSAKMVKSLVFSDNDLKELKSVVNNIDTLCNDYSIKMKQIINYDKKEEHSGSVGSETRSDLATDALIFGRDRDIEFILDLMFNVLYGDFYRKADDPNLGEGSSAIDDPNLGEGSKAIDDPNLGEGSTVKKGGVLEQSQNVRRVERYFYGTQKLAVIPIFGVGGVGKTVVAKKIYNNESVNKHFTLKAWVYVSENYNDKKILREILFSFKDSFRSDPSMNLEYLGKKLKETIKNQRFLLILDNLRDMTELKWNDLKSLLCFGDVGSVVVVTTQNRSIADTIRTLSVVTLECLDTEPFWDLFEYFAFGRLKLGDLKDEPPLSPSKHDDLKKIGKQIADKLHGLPLAGEFIGTLLSKRLEREFWEDICRSNWWNIEGVRKNILPSIAVGYNYLDPDLKQCFVFCSIFPKLYVFKRKRLVEMWIAQGFIQPNKEETDILEKGEKRIEDIGEKRFGELIDRSFFQPTLRDGEYIMHDLVRDLAIAVSSNEFCFVKSHDKCLPSLARHLGIDCDNLEVEWECKDTTRLRTVILFGNWTNCSAKSIGNIFAKYNRLRVLDVSYIELTTNEPINVACQLSHLRFVDLSFTGTKLIPDEFCALFHLEVLDVRGCNFKKLPERMNNLISLRHLYASPKTISLISGIGKLTKLQEIEEFCIEDSERPVIYKGHKISELMHMNELSGHLVLSNLKAVSSKEEAVKSQLDKKIYLKNLELSFSSHYFIEPGTEVNKEVLDALKPSSGLETLNVNGCRWESFPDWVFHHGFNNLKDISVKSYWLRSLPAFGELRSLELLCFDNLPLIEKVGREFYGSSHVVFPSLKELTFREMNSWTHWSNAEARKTIFPRLKKLRLERCIRLKELPTDSSISSVVEFNLVGCDCLCNIGKVLQGMPSLSHLIITKVHIYCLSIYCTPLNSLEVMHLEGIKKLCLVEGLKSLVNLRKLVIEDFREILESYEVEQENDQISQEENEEQCLQFLTYLHLSHSRFGSQSLPRVGRLSSLRTLLIEMSTTVEYTTGEESWFIQLTSLEKLEFRKCRRMKSLPSTLWLLTSLKKLHIYDCPEMLSLPENGLPKNLAELYIDQCPYLIDRCQPTEGDDWLKISHIPFVRLDGTSHLQSSSSLSSFTGTGHLKVANRIALQMCALFFDRNSDGIIYINKTYQGIRAIGVSVPVAIAGSLFINGALSPLTRPPGKISLPCLPIYIENINQSKHDSDTDDYDSDGRFVSEKFEQILTNYAKTNPNVLSANTTRIGGHASSKPRSW